MADAEVTSRAGLTDRDQSEPASSEELPHAARRKTCADACRDAYGSHLSVAGFSLKGCQTPVAMWATRRV